MKLRLDELSTSSVIALIVFSVVGVLIVTPRPTAPHVIPLPEIDQGERRRVEERERNRALRVRDGRLDNSVRGVGEILRRVGLQLAHRNRAEQALLSELRDDTRRLLDENRSEDLLDLRALQAELFLQAVRRFENSKTPDRDLLELGGHFAAVAQSSWIDPQGQFLLSDDQLRLLFRVHWGKLTQTYGTEVFGPSREELRRYYSTNLQFPHAPSSDPAEEARAQLAQARALSHVDVDYPLLLAEGILLLKAGQGMSSARALSQYLRIHRDGPWVQVARNHLRLAQNLTRSTLGP